MAGLFDKQADIYLDARPMYPSEWYRMLAENTLHHSLAWDVGTGNGQAAVGVAAHYEQVIGTDISESQLKYAISHPRVRYLHTQQESMSDDELVTLIGGDDSVDLITVAQAVHWFDLPRFYTIANRLLRKPGGLIAVWGYKQVTVTPTFDETQRRWYETTLSYWHSKSKYLHNNYKTLPFPFESVGLGREEDPLVLDFTKEVRFEGYLRLLRSFSAVASAKEEGVDLLSEEVVKELEDAWGGAQPVRTVWYKAFMLVGKVRV
ncbi:putative methyltransferase ddb_g0268948 [Phtheirospermum japonicum]|uniref:Putative methyltransferase ddb_g0268948 n=1 Tax=Phtheirospermum japonicum TaxID=374723 RepID=A0A830CWR4_9LAMI|nr:putative methyltransferase ddb_g0268948 [Phtheirospermum japonicum]